MHQLGVPSIDTIQVLTPAGVNAHRNPVYPAAMRFSTAPLPALEFTRVVGCDFSGQNIIALVGRDVMRGWLVVYNGPTGEVVLSF